MKMHEEVDALCRLHIEENCPMNNSRNEDSCDNFGLPYFRRFADAKLCGKRLSVSVCVCVCMSYIGGPCPLSYIRPQRRT